MEARWNLSPFALTCCDFVSFAFECKGLLLPRMEELLTLAHIHEDILLPTQRSQPALPGTPEDHTILYVFIMLLHGVSMLLATAATADAHAPSACAHAHTLQWMDTVGIIHHCCALPYWCSSALVPIPCFSAQMVQR